MKFNIRYKSGAVIIPLNKSFYNFFSKISNRKTRLPIGKHSDTHHHIFFSFYVTKNMQALKGHDNNLYNLPNRALTIVMPFANHTWFNKTGNSNECFVFDLSPGHSEHIIMD